MIPAAGSGAGRYVTVSDGTRLYCELYGNAGGPPVVLIHGGLVHSVTWQEQVAALAPTYRVLTYDVRGYGRSEAPPGADAYSMERSAADVAELLAQLGLGSAHVLGFSQGGMIGLTLAARRPELLRSLVLVSTTARVTPEQAGGYTARAARLEAAGPGEEANVYLSRAFSPGFVESHPQFIAEYAGIVRRNRAHALAATFRTLANFDVHDQLGQVRCPALILSGALDVAFPPDPHAVGLHRLLPRAEVVVLPGVGHTIHAEAAIGFNRHLLAFLAAAEAEPKMA